MNIATKWSLINLQDSSKKLKIQVSSFFYLDTYEQLKKAAIKQKQINSSINKTEDNPKMPTKRNYGFMEANFKKKDSVTTEKS